MKTTNRDKNFTPIFAAPEQHLGEKISLKADIWALGIIIYNVFTN